MSWLGNLFAPGWRRLVSISFLVVLALLIGARLFAMTPMAHSWVEAQIERQSNQGQTIEVDDLTGDLLGRIEIAEIRVRDETDAWLIIEQADLAWSPWSLVFGHLNLKHVEAERISALRRPRLLSDEEEPRGALPERIQLAALNIKTLDLSDGVAGPAQSYQLTGRLDARGNTGNAALDLRPNTAFGDVASVDLTWGGDTLIDGHAQIDGAPSGLIASFLQVPDDQTISARLDASGTILDWQLDADVSVGDARVLTLATSADLPDIRVEGELDLSAFGRLRALQRRLGDTLIFSGEVGIDQAFSADLETQNGSLNATGTLAALGAETRLTDVRLRASALDLSTLTGVSRVSVASLEAEGDVDIVDGAYAFDGLVTVPAAQYGDYAISDLESAGRHVLTGASVSITSEISVGDYSGFPPVMGMLFPGRVQGRLDSSYTFETGQFEVGEAVLIRGDNVVSASGTLERNGALDAFGALALSDLFSLQSLRGTWRLDGASLRQLAAEFDGVARLPDEGSSLNSLLGDRAELSLRADQNGNDININRASVRSDILTATATGRVRDRDFDLSGTFSADRLSVASASVDGLIGAFDFIGPINDPKLELSASADQADGAGEVFTSPRLDASARFSGTRRASVKLNSLYRGSNLNSDFDAALLANEIEISNLRAVWADLQTSGDARLTLSDVSQSNLALQVSGAAPMVSELEGSITYSDEALAMDVRSKTVELGPARLRSADVQLSGEWPDFSGTLTYDGDVPLWGVAEPLAGDHGLVVDVNAQTLAIDGALRFAEQEIVITDPIRASLAPSVIASGRADALGGQVEFSFDQMGRALSRLVLTDISMQQIGPFIQRRGLRGVMNGTAEVQIVGSELNGAADVKIRDLARGPSNQAHVDLAVIMEAGQLTLDLAAFNKTGDLSVTGSAATQIAHRGDLFSLRPVAGAAVPISINGSGPLAPLWALAAPPDLRVEGDFSVDLSNGDGRTFRFAGPATLENGVFEDGFTGLHLVGINAGAELFPDRIELSQAKAQGGRSGTIEATGIYSFTGDGEIALTLDRLRAFKRSDVTAEVSGNAIVDRRNRRTHVDGDLEIKRARINLSNLPGAGYTTLDVDFETPGEDDRENTPTREAISLDVDVRADDRVFVSGLGIESEWGVRATITGPAGAPRINGEANLVRGDADLLSRSFRLTEGVLSFAGDLDDSEINLRADRTGDGITTSILVSGPVLSPEIGLSSDPALPDDEILSRVLFGRSPTNLSALQAAQLAAAAAQLAGGDAFSLTGELEAATGLDRLDFGMNDAGEATLSTGKYLSNDLYLEIESGGSGAPGVALEWTPLDNVELDAEIDPELGPKVAIQWKRDFDRLPGETRREDPARASGSE